MLRLSGCDFTCRNTHLLSFKEHLYLPRLGDTYTQKLPLTTSCQDPQPQRPAAFIYHLMYPLGASGRDRYSFLLLSVYQPQKAKDPPVGSSLLQWPDLRAQGAVRTHTLSRERCVHQPDMSQALLAGKEQPLHLTSGEYGWDSAGVQGYSQAAVQTHCCAHSLGATAQGSALGLLVRSPRLAIRHGTAPSRTVSQQGEAGPNQAGPEALLWLPGSAVRLQIGPLPLTTARTHPILPPDTQLWGVTAILSELLQRNRKRFLRLTVTKSTEQAGRNTGHSVQQPPPLPASKCGWEVHPIQQYWRDLGDRRALTVHKTA
jgi:hypothetical protein